MSARSIPCVFLRAGTSRGAFILERDLPNDPKTRETVVAKIFGSPDKRQIDGLGGGDPLTSKIAVVANSAREDADVDYTFGQVSIDTGNVFWVGNCGNMSSGVGPFAIRKGLVKAKFPVTEVRIFNTNTKKILTAEVQVDHEGNVVEEGDNQISGVPGTGAAILLDFGDCGGAVTGKILPTGNPIDQVIFDDQTYDFSVVDAATPFVFVPAEQLQMNGVESADDIDANAGLLNRLERIREHAARLLGLVGDDEAAKDVSPSIPRVVAVSSPQSFIAADGHEVIGSELSLVARQQSMQRTHKTYAVTGALCTAVAAQIPHTVVHNLAQHRGEHFVIGHPGGIISAKVVVDDDGSDLRVKKAAIVRTARVIMDGVAMVPERIWHKDEQVSGAQDPVLLK